MTTLPLGHSAYRWTRMSGASVAPHVPQLIWPAERRAKNLWARSSSDSGAGWLSFNPRGHSRRRRPCMRISVILTTIHLPPIHCRSLRTA